MFQSVQAAPPDPILGLTEAYRADPNPEKINLGVGVYQDANGQTPALQSVKAAALREAEGLSSLSYLPIGGSAEYAAAVQQLIFGVDHEVTRARRAITMQTPGGTAALRVAADFIKQNLPESTVWLPSPTWANHPAVFAAAGVPTKTYPYFDAATNGLAYDQMKAAIREITEYDVVLLHGCCHNPTGVDPTIDQWREIAGLLYARDLLPLVDFAYQGFGEGVDADAGAVREFCRPGEEFLLCSSFSKNFGLYRERVGALTIIAQNQATASAVESQTKRSIRANYSNPPAHGANLVTTVLGDKALRQQWLGEVDAMRTRITETRQVLVDALAKAGAPGDFSFIKRQRGMFSYSGLTPRQVERLRHDHAIYLVSSGRINVAGISPGNVDRLAAAIAQVLQG